MITMTATTTIQDVASQINNFSGMGLTASVIKTATNTYSLMVKSALGENKQIKIEARNGANATISQLNFESPASTDAAKQVVAGVDAAFTLDGIAITRPTNTVSDLIPGVTLGLKKTSATNVELGAAYDEKQALEILTAFVTEINTLTHVNDKHDSHGHERQRRRPTSGRHAVRSYVNRLKSITTTPIANYKDDPIFLSNFGVMTELDGR